MYRNLPKKCADSIELQRLHGRKASKKQKDKEFKKKKFERTNIYVEKANLEKPET